MNNPFDPTKEPSKHHFYNKGYKVGKSGFISLYPGNSGSEKRTSWSLGYLHAVQRKKMNQLILGDKAYDQNNRCR